jgi:hypothetical protein
MRLAPQWAELAKPSGRESLSVPHFPRILNRSVSCRARSHERIAPDQTEQSFNYQAAARLVRHALRARRWYSARFALDRFVRQAFNARRRYSA